MKWIRRHSAKHSVDSSSESTPATSVSNSLKDAEQSPFEITRKTTADPSPPELAGNSALYTTTLDTDHIRLLRIEPGIANSPLICTLEASPLEHSPQYEAVSYCWGPQKAFHPITLDAKPGFQVTTHLYDGLCRFRRAKTARYVWIDAICINQSDKDERSHQVDHMRTIFGRARHVIIWMGGFSPSSWQLPTCKCHVPNGVGDLTQAGCAEPGLSAFEHNDMGKAIRDKLHADERRGRQGETLGQVWWKRLWVVQEFAVARQLPTICIGPHTISWQFFAERLWSAGDDHFSAISESHKLRVSGINS